VWAQAAWWSGGWSDQVHWGLVRREAWSADSWILPTKEIPVPTGHPPLEGSWSAGGSRVARRLAMPLREFLDTEVAGGLVLLAATAIALVWANSPWQEAYQTLWSTELAVEVGRSSLALDLRHWVNEGLMALFFFVVGLEIKRELVAGELRSPRNAALPVVTALGGMVAPALVFLVLNGGGPGERGWGIPMATDIAFALGVLALLGSRVPASLKVFLTALAVMDDLGAIVVIAVFYTAELSLAHLLGALAVFGLLVALNRLRVMSLLPYLLGGALMWFLMLKSGVHATVAGVLLAFAIPFTGKEDDAESPSHRLEHFLHKPVAFGILPVFALANTAVVVGAGALQSLTASNSLGIIL
jgi:NhaA family Na+:H+ antiporter